VGGKSAIRELLCLAAVALYLEMTSGGDAEQEEESVQELDAVDGGIPEHQLAMPMPLPRDAVAYGRMGRSGSEQYMHPINGFGNVRREGGGGVCHPGEGETCTRIRPGILEHQLALPPDRGPGIWPCQRFGGVRGRGGGLGSCCKGQLSTGTLPC